MQINTIQHLKKVDFAEYRGQIEGYGWAKTQHSATFRSIAQRFVARQTNKNQHLKKMLLFLPMHKKLFCGFCGSIKKAILIILKRL